MKRQEVEERASTAQAALENLSLQLGSERAWRLAFEMELKWRKAEKQVRELRAEVRRLEGRLRLRRPARAAMRLDDRRQRKGRVERDQLDRAEKRRLGKLHRGKK